MQSKSSFPRTMFGRLWGARPAERVVGLARTGLDSAVVTMKDAGPIEWFDLLLAESEYWLNHGRDPWMMMGSDVDRHAATWTQDMIYHMAAGLSMLVHNTERLRGGNEWERFTRAWSRSSPLWPAAILLLDLWQQRFRHEPGDFGAALLAGALNAQAWEAALNMTPYLPAAGFLVPASALEPASDEVLQALINRLNWHAAALAESNDDPDLARRVAQQLPLLHNELMAEHRVMTLESQHELKCRRGQTWATTARDNRSCTPLDDDGRNGYCCPFECPLCLEETPYPQLLKCGHAFCHPCALHLLTRPRQQCPTCRGSIDGPTAAHIRRSSVPSAATTRAAFVRGHRESQTRRRRLF